jgi:TPR repeat protein
VPRQLEAGVLGVGASARHGNAEAQYALGSLYADGQGVQRNAIKALQWIAEAARNGHQSAIQTLLRLRGEQQRGRAASSRSVPYPLP